MIMFADAPEHGVLRRLATPHFTARSMRTLEPRVQALADSLLDGILDRTRRGETVDLYRDYAEILPFGAIVHLLDIPQADSARFREWVAGVTFGIGLPSDEVHRASEALCTFFDEVVEERRARPGDDVISALVQQSDRLSPPLGGAEITAFAIMLFAAGTDTTAGLIGNWLELVLTDRRDVLAAVRADPSLIPGSIEEMLRFNNSNQVVPRAAVQATEIRGVAIPEGALLSLLLGSANRDEDHFGSDADTYRIDRNPTDALGFGYGTHLCLGAALARMETRVALESLVRRTRKIELAAPIEHNYSFWLRACRSIPVSLG
jgi:cytochrome P450